ncbi:MAG: VIT domain-containing protein [Myxococcota bacterium]
MHEQQQQHSGLMGQGGVAVPLEGVKIEAKVTGTCSEVTITQRYRNRESVDVEAVYVFPLEESAAVCGFGAQVGDRRIEGRVEEREKAFETYDDAMAEGHGAMLLDQERPNIFTASVGNLKPGQTIEVWVRYVAQLQPEGRATRLMIPTTVSPRYVPTDRPAEVGEPDHERINPPHKDQVPYGLTLSVEIVSEVTLVELESPSHTVRTRWTDTGATVELSAAQTALDRDFVLLFEAKDAHVPRATVAREKDGTRVAMVTFVPSFEGQDRTSREVIVVLDCSGSMGGTSIAEARRALALCVRALEEGDRFNIVRFGSRFDTMWPSSRLYTQASLEEASRWIAAVDANMGGTEILAPLRHIMAQERPEGLSREVLLLTDGQVSNEAQVIALCRENAGRARVFAFGIGAGASEHLVRGVARASRGAAEFIHPGERIEPKVLRMFRRVATPALQDIKVDWGAMEVEQTPVEVPPVFEGEALTILGRIKHGDAREVVLSAGAHRWSVPIDLEHAQVDSPVPTLWARGRIRDIEDGRVPQRGSRQGRGRDRNHERLVALGTRYGLMTSVTSYVAVETRAHDERSQGEAQLRRVPVALTVGWGGKSVGTPQSVLRMASIQTLTQTAHAGPALDGAVSGLAASAPMPAAKSSKGQARRRVSGARSFKRAEAPTGGAPSAPPFLPPPAPAQAPPPPAPMASAPVPSMSPSSAAMPGLPPAAPPMPSLGGRGFGGPSGAGGALDEGGGGPDLFGLLLTQRADGSFEPGPQLKAFLREHWHAFETLAQGHGARLVATAVVVALLEHRFAGRRDEWEMAAGKAKRWLKTQGQTPDVTALVG